MLLKPNFFLFVFIVKISSSSTVRHLIAKKYENPNYNNNNFSPYISVGGWLHPPRGSCLTVWVTQPILNIVQPSQNWFSFYFCVCVTLSPLILSLALSSCLPFPSSLTPDFFLKNFLILLTKISLMLLNKPTGYQLCISNLCHWILNSV